MSTYCVTQSEANDWEEMTYRHKTRPPADERLEQFRLAGQFSGWLVGLG